MKVQSNLLLLIKPPPVNRISCQSDLLSTEPPKSLLLKGLWLELYEETKLENVTRSHTHNSEIIPPLHNILFRLCNISSSPSFESEPQIIPFPSAPTRTSLPLIARVNKRGAYMGRGEERVSGVRLWQPLAVSNNQLELVWHFGNGKPWTLQQGPWTCLDGS